MKFTKHNDKSEILKRGGLDLPPIFFHIDFKNSSIDLVLFLNERYGLCQRISPGGDLGLDKSGK